MEPGTNEIVWDNTIKDGLYVLELPPQLTGTVLVASTSRSIAQDALHCHSIVGHPSAFRYQSLSMLPPSVPYFTFETLKNLECIPRITAKVRQAPVSRNQIKVTAPLELVHLDISGRSGLHSPEKTCTHCPYLMQGLQCLM